jgi:6-phosphofructokinase 2
MILTVTLNPALDKSTVVQKLFPEKKMRCENMQVEAGGGGINISKAIKELNGECTALFPSGGMNGKAIEELLSAKDIQLKVIPIKGETRENFVATDISTNAQYRFVFPGPALSAGELEACLQAIEKFQPVPQIIIFSGSLPPGTPDEIVAKLASVSKQMGAKFITDTSGNTLKQAANEGVYLLKPNLSELCFLVGKEYLELSEVEDAAKSIIDKGSSEVIVVSMGPSGALLLTKNISRRVPAPIVKKTSTVGAGDSMVAGMALMLSQGRPLVEVVQFGVACGSAATMNAGSELCKKEDVLRLFEWIKAHTN